MNSVDEPKPLALDFLDTSQSSQMINHTSVPKINTQQVLRSFIKDNEALWQSKGQSNYYQKGLFLGKGNSTNILLEEFLKKFRKTLEEIVREELKSNNQTSENFKDIFKALEALFNVLITYLEILKIDSKDAKFLPILHGFIDSYINSIVNVEQNG
jgi:hypothetical protein